MTLSETLLRLRYNYVPDHLIGELLTKRWTDNAVPVAALLLVVFGLGSFIPDFFTLRSGVDAMRQLGEFSLVVTGLTVVMLGGGIDLSVGAVFALGGFATVTVIYIFGGSVWVAIIAAILIGALAGSVTGFLVGYLRLRAFLTTIVMYLILRSIYEILTVRFASFIQTSSVDNPFFNFIGDSTILGLPVSFTLAALIAILAHIFMSRSRWGWHIQAVGGSRRSAHNIGIPVRRTIFMTYVISGICSSLGGFLIGARLGGVGPGTGNGLEIAALTAAVLGGVSLGGGRGSITKGLIGAVVILALTNGLIRLGFASGSTQMVLGVLLALAVILDVRWLKNRHKVLAKIYVAPVYSRMVQGVSAAPGSNIAYSLDNRLAGAEAIGLGVIEGPEDVILDTEDNLYTGTRHGEIVRFLAPDYKRHEVYAHIGGFPLGMAFDKDGALKVCVGGMGLYSVAKDRTVTRLSAETNRSIFSIIDDARLRDPNDCDVAPDGRIFFTDSTTRYDAHDWALDSVESRPTGRLLCYNPTTAKTHTVLRNLCYSNGVCLSHDGQAILFAESWGCSISRYWIDGPKKGTVEPLITNMPGYPDNINRSSDGTYWVALLGMRTPSYDLALRMPDMRRRMTRRLPQDDWLFPNINTGGLARFDDAGNIVEAFGDLAGESHPMVTSMREHKGQLFIGGILNNRVGRLKLEKRNKNWTGPASYWSGK